MTEQLRRKNRRELGCGCVLALAFPFIFIHVVILLMGITALIPHDLPLQQDLNNVSSVELVNSWDHEPERLLLTESQMDEFLPQLAKLKTYGGLGDPIMAYGDLQVILTYENGDQDILTELSSVQITGGQERMLGFRCMDEDDLLPIFDDYFPELHWEPDTITEAEYLMKTFLRLAVPVLIFFLLWSVFAAVSIVRYAKVNDPYWADCIIVLGAGTNGREPNPVFRERLNHAITLYEGGYSSHIILTGGLSEGNTLTDSQIAANYLTARGIPADAILLEMTSTITQENLAGAKAIMDTEGMKTALIVSDPLHMKRAMLMADDYGINAYSSPTPTTRYQTAKTKLPFLMREVFFYVGYQIYRIFVKV